MKELEERNGNWGGEKKRRQVWLKEGRSRTLGSREMEERKREKEKETLDLRVL